MPLKFCFHFADQPRERLLAEAVTEGVKRHGDTATAIPKNAELEDPNAADVHGMVGVKAAKLFHAALRSGAHALMFDKGYTRHVAPTGPRTWEFWRVSLDAHHPVRYLMDQPYPGDRFAGWGKLVNPWRTDGEHIVFAGSSEKYHSFMGLSDPTAYATKIIKQVSKMTGRPVVYRPKPSWKGAIPIEGARFSGPDEHIDGVVKNAWCLITHGSNAALDAIMLGVPAIVLGDGIAKPISSTDLADAVGPRMVHHKTRAAWFHAVAYQQFTMAEIAAGEMWAHIRPKLYA